MVAAGDNPEKALYRFCEKLIALRKKHPSLRSERFLHGTVEVLPGIANVGWFDERAEVLTPGAWADGSAQLLSLRRAVLNGNMVDMTLLLLNASHEDREFVFPHIEFAWEIKLDTAHPDLKPTRPAVPRMIVGARSVVLLAVAVKT
jgi:glycogen operon protein